MILEASGGLLIQGWCENVCREISLALMFCSRCKRFSWFILMLYNRKLLMSILDVMKAWTRTSVVCLSIYFFSNVANRHADWSRDCFRWGSMDWIKDNAKISNMIRWFDGRITNPNRWNMKFWGLLLWAYDNKFSLLIVEFEPVSVIQERTL